MPLIAGAKTKAAPEDTAFIVLFLLGFKFPRSGLVQLVIDQTTLPIYM
jgi:hypothetical protein